MSLSPNDFTPSVTRPDADDLPWHQKPYFNRFKNYLMEQWLCAYHAGSDMETTLPLADPTDASKGIEMGLFDDSYLAYIEPPPAGPIKVYNKRRYPLSFWSGFRHHTPNVYHFAFKPDNPEEGDIVCAPADIDIMKDVYYRLEDLDWMDVYDGHAEIYKDGEWTTLLTKPEVIIGGATPPDSDAPVGSVFINDLGAMFYKNSTYKRPDDRPAWTRYGEARPIMTEFPNGGNVTLLGSDDIRLHWGKKKYYEPHIDPLDAAKIEWKEVIPKTEDGMEIQNIVYGSSWDEDIVGDDDILKSFVSNKKLIGGQVFWSHLHYDIGRLYVLTNVTVSCTAKIKLIGQPGSRVQGAISGDCQLGLFTFPRKVVDLVLNGDGEAEVVFLDAIGTSSNRIPLNPWKSPDSGVAANIVGAGFKSAEVVSISGFSIEYASASVYLKSIVGSPDKLPTKEKSFENFETRKDTTGYFTNNGNLTTIHSDGSFVRHVPVPSFFYSEESEKYFGDEVLVMGSEGSAVSSVHTSDTPKWHGDGQDGRSTPFWGFNKNLPPRHDSLAISSEEEIYSYTQSYDDVAMRDMDETMALTRNHISYLLTNGTSEHMIGTANTNNNETPNDIVTEPKSGYPYYIYNSVVRADSYGFSDLPPSDPEFFIRLSSYRGSRTPNAGLPEDSQLSYEVWAKVRITGEDFTYHIRYNWETGDYNVFTFEDAIAWTDSPILLDAAKAFTEESGIGTMWKLYASYESAPFQYDFENDIRAGLQAAYEVISDAEIIAPATAADTDSEYEESQRTLELDFDLQIRIMGSSKNFTRFPSQQEEL